MLDLVVILGSDRSHRLDLPSLLLHDLVQLVFELLFLPLPFDSLHLPLWQQLRDFADVVVDQTWDLQVMDPVELSDLLVGHPFFS